MNFSEFEGKVFETDDINEHRLEPELKRIKGIGEALVYGDPYGTAKKLDGHQGDNIYSCKKNDGLVAVVNVLRMAGIDCSENEIVKCAIDNKWCEHSFFGSAVTNGKTLHYDRYKILEKYGISSEIIYWYEYGGDIDSIADYVEQGRGVIMQLRYSRLYGVLSDDYDSGLLMANRCVTITGTARDPETKALKGFFICDSAKAGFGNKSVFVTTEDLRRAYGSYTYGVPEANIVVTDKPIR